MYIWVDILVWGQNKLIVLIYKVIIESYHCRQANDPMVSTRRVRAVISAGAAGYIYSFYKVTLHITVRNIPVIILLIVQHHLPFMCRFLVFMAFSLFPCYGIFSIFFKYNAVSTIF